MKSKNEVMKTSSQSRITLNDLVTFIVSNDIANYDYAKKEVKKLKRKNTLLSMTLVSYILCKEGLIHSLVKRIKEFTTKN